MIRTSISASRYAKAKPAPVRAAYTVLAPFALNHVMTTVGEIVMLSEAEAKYHLLAVRIAPVEKTVEVSPSAPEAPAVESEVDGDNH